MEEYPSIPPEELVEGLSNAEWWGGAADVALEWANMLQPTEPLSKHVLGVLWHRGMLKAFDTAFIKFDEWYRKERKIESINIYERALIAGRLELLSDSYYLISQSEDVQPIPVEDQEVTIANGVNGANLTRDDEEKAEEWLFEFIKKIPTHLN